jgi:hypothetical protein
MAWACMWMGRGPSSLAAGMTASARGTACACIGKDTSTWAPGVRIFPMGMVWSSTMAAASMQGSGGVGTAQVSGSDRTRRQTSQQSMRPGSATHYLRSTPVSILGNGNVMSAMVSELW